MEQPEDIVVPGKLKKVCELDKVTLWTKTSTQTWHNTLDQIVLANGFKNDESDKCVHIKVTRSLFVCIFVICWSSIETLMI